jgi:hypothetical protein
MSVKYERDGWAFSTIKRIDSQRSRAPAWAVFALAVSDTANPRRPIQLAILGFDPTPQLFIAICDNWLELAPRERGVKPSA